MSKKIHVSLNYHYAPLDVIDVFAVGVRDGIFTNDPPFTVPPILQPAFQVIIDNYINKRGAYLQGGLAKKVRL